MNNEDLRCPYCGDLFDDEDEKGEHIAEEHVDSSKKISRSGKSSDSSIINDWKNSDD